MFDIILEDMLLDIFTLYYFVFIAFMLTDLFKEIRSTTLSGKSGNSYPETLQMQLWTM